MVVCCTPLLTKSQFRDVWNVDAITPINNSGRRKDVRNYRLNTLLPARSSRTTDLPEFQHGFVKKRSTVSNLMLYVSSINSSLEKRCQVDSVYVDFAKAFDKVHHNLLFLPSIALPCRD
uniref:(northern house mosquito) hypothetical protein n=1 Tax=Culex pipiens TaxID=7175 RepID=A0A8D8AK23_CULPI